MDKPEKASLANRRGNPAYPTSWAGQKLKTLTQKKAGRMTLVHPFLSIYLGLQVSPVPYTMRAKKDEEVLEKLMVR
jgi:hypothetical protein